MVSLPQNRTRPSFGVRRPEITSNNVVLPAPFGPIRPSTTPSLTVRLTSDSALIPPKRTLTPSSPSTSPSCACSAPSSGIALRRTARGASVVSGPPTIHPPSERRASGIGRWRADRPESRCHQPLCQVLDSHDAPVGRPPRCRRHASRTTWPRQRAAPCGSPRAWSIEVRSRSPLAECRAPIEEPGGCAARTPAPGAGHRRRCRPPPTRGSGLRRDRAARAPTGRRRSP